jgi:hypothetical protein
MSTGNVRDRSRPQVLLEKELATLKKLIPFEAAANLSVCWKPNPAAPVLGEVIGHTVFLYDSDIEEAVGTLRHEFLDYYLSKRLISPVMAMVNLLIDLKTKEIYEEKEKVVECLLKFIDLSQDAEK